MTTDAAQAAPRRVPFFVPTATKQCWGFMIGSTFFAVGSAPGLSPILGATTSNLLYFTGAWFFTTAGLIQLFLSGAVSVPVNYSPGRMVRAEWLAGATLVFGTLMFNVSTTAALHAQTIRAQEKFVWNPDAGGSFAFLVSAVMAFVAYARVHPEENPGRRAWWSVVVNFVGCVAFAFSAVGAYILPGGNVVDGTVAGVGTFVGAICFFVSSLLVLPFWDRTRPAALVGSPPDR